MNKDIIAHLRQKLLPCSAAALVLVLFLALPAICPAAAAPAVNWDVSPSNPYVGDTLVITGTAASNAELGAAVSFEKTVSASGGEYEYEIDEVDVPGGENNRFTVRAEGVKNLNVQVKKYVWLPPLSKDAVGGVATISKSHVPPMTYGIKIYGDALEEKSSVSLTVTASRTITADSEGDFRYEYDTDTMPAGDYIITIGGVSKTITLRYRSSSGGHSDTPSATIRPAREKENAPEETLEPVGREYEVDSGENLEIETDEGEAKTGSGTGIETPAEENSVPFGSLIAFGIIVSLLAITLIRKSRK